MHPLMPFITEEIWQTVAPMAGKSGDTISNQEWPQADDSLRDASAVNDLEWVRNFIVGVRSIRSEMDVKPSQGLNVMLADWTEQDQTTVSNQRVIHCSTGKDRKRHLAETTLDEAPESATALAGEMKILIPLAGLIDKDAEIARLEKEIGKLSGNLEKTEARLNNPNFADKAPEKVVEGVRQQAAEQRKALEQLQAQLDKIKAL